nr:unnamed protein product [Digitaria exilis]
MAASSSPPPHQAPPCPNRRRMATDDSGSGARSSSSWPSSSTSTMGGLLVRCLGQAAVPAAAVRRRTAATSWPAAEKQQLALALRLCSEVSSTADPDFLDSSSAAAEHLQQQMGGELLLLPRRSKKGTLRFGRGTEEEIEGMSSLDGGACYRHPRPRHRRRARESRGPEAPSPASRPRTLRRRPPGVRPCGDELDSVALGHGSWSTGSRELRRASCCSGRAGRSGERAAAAGTGDAWLARRAPPRSAVGDDNTMRLEDDELVVGAAGEALRLPLHVGNIHH